ncbi:MAG: RNA-binding protein [Dehalococcoidales bacterium]|jgi:predicted RNA-binding protein|nr:RNA-binding protein [Dehalococcoidales bacterium]|tara:strand:- start:1238 stop:1432 length:195 start_codon:yes stop_codon:yes gene_type:complete
MCLSKAYVDTDGKRELLMEEVASIGFEKDKLLLKTLFGEQKEIKAVVKQVDFVTNSIILKNLEP